MELAAMHRRFAGARVARLATVGPDAQPHVIPVCFVATADRLVTAIDHKPKTTSDLRRLDNIRANPPVSLLVDHYEEDWSLLWWVRVDGTARVVEDGPERDGLVEPLVEKYRGHYTLERLTGPVIVVELERWRGWTASSRA